jgi:hypothetical protein
MQKQLIQRAINGLNPNNSNDNSSNNIHAHQNVIIITTNTEIIHKRDRIIKDLEFIGTTICLTNNIIISP